MEVHAGAINGAGRDEKAEADPQRARCAAVVLAPAAVVVASAAAEPGGLAEAAHREGTAAAGGGRPTLGSGPGVHAAAALNDAGAACMTAERAAGSAAATGIQQLACTVCGATQRKEGGKLHLCAGCASVC